MSDIIVIWALFISGYNDVGPVIAKTTVAGNVARHLRLVCVGGGGTIWSLSVISLTNQHIEISEK